MLCDVILQVVDSFYLLIPCSGIDCCLLAELSESANWNYRAMAQELAQVCATAAEREEAVRSKCGALQAQSDGLTKEVTEKRMINEQIDRLAQTKKTLEALPNVQEALVSHETGTAVVKMSAPVENSVLKTAVEEKGYTVTDIH